MSILSNINFMRKFIAFPCATPNPLILIETAFEALLPELWEFLSFQVVQQVLPVAKKIGGRDAPRWQERRPMRDYDWRRTRGHGVHMSSNPPERRSVGEKLGPNTVLFRLIDFEQRALFYWMLVDLATEFMARWTTLIYLKQKCPFDHPCTKSGVFSSAFIGMGGTRMILPILDVGSLFSGGLEIQTRYFAGDPTHTDATAIAFEATIRKFHSDEPPSNAWVQLERTDTGEVVAGGKGLGEVTPEGGRRSGGFYVRSKGATAHNYHLVLINMTDEVVAVTAGVLHLSGSFCVEASPLLPFDHNHLLPRIPIR